MAETLDHLLHSVFVPSLLLTGEQFALFVLPLLLSGIAMQWVSAAITRNGVGIIGFAFYYITAPGIIMHEFAHAAMCILFRHRIHELKPFAPDRRTGVLGYVTHSASPGTLYQKAGYMFIAIGPLVAGAAILFLCMKLFLPQAQFAAPAIIGEDAASLVPAFAKSAAAMLKSIIYGVSGLASSELWKAVLLVYAALCAGSQMRLSPEDIRSAIPGFAGIAFAAIAINTAVISLGAGAAAQAAYRHAAMNYSAFVFCVMGTSLIVNTCVLALVAAIRRIRG